MSLTNKTPAATYKDLLQLDNSNSGVDNTLRQVKDGDGDGSALYIERNSIKIKPASDDTALLDIHDKDGNSKFTVDTTNDLVKALGHKLNTQYAYFGTQSIDGIPASSGTHYMIPFGSLFASNTDVTIGTGTDPDTSLTLTSTADDLIPMIWYLPDDITIDAVHVWTAGNNSTGDTINFHLMSYSIRATDDANCGDLVSGVVVADGADISHDGYEQADFQTLTIQNANVDQGKVIVFTIHSDGTNSDYAINATIKYHLR